MQQPQLTMTGDIPTPTKEQLLAYGFVEEVADFVSPTSQIRYRFRRMVSADRAYIFIPLFVEGPNYTVLKLHVRSNFGPTEQPVIPTLISKNPTLGLIRYPDAIHVEKLPGLKQIFDQGYGFVGPMWCLASLAYLEQSVSGGTRESTVIVPEILQTPGGVIKRKFEIVPGLQSVRSPDIVNKLAVEVTSTVQQGTQSVEVKKSFTGQEFLQLPNAGSLIQERQIIGAGNTKNVFIGRPYCLDIISEFIVPAAVIPALQQEVSSATIGTGPAGFMPPPTDLSQPQLMTPAGFQQPPAAVSTVVSQQPLQRAQLPDDVRDRLKNFLLNQVCGTGKRTKTDLKDRISTLVDKILDLAKDGYQKLQGKFLNVSTCYVGKGDTKQLRRTIGTIPGTQQPFNLSMAMPDMSFLIKGNTAEVIPDTNMFVTEIFYQIAEAAISRLGTTTSQIAETVGAVPLSVLDALPSGPKPAQRPQIAARSPFVGAVPLPGVTDVTTPITEGKRCLPGLMAKKRD